MDYLGDNKCKLLVLNKIEVNPLFTGKKKNIISVIIKFFELKYLHYWNLKLALAKPHQIREIT